MKEINDGGPAFGEFEKVGDIAVSNGGLSKRDYFSAKAMQGMIAAPYQPASDQFMLARDAYAVADAMIAEGSK